MFSRLLWPELAPEPATRMELADVPLSAPVTRALQLAFARELGERIDRAIARLGGGELEVISQGKLEAAAGAEGVHWRVLSYYCCVTKYAKSLILLPFLARRLAQNCRVKPMS